MERAEVVESPRKRLKVDNVQNEQDVAVIAIPDPDSSSNLPTAAQAKGPKEVDVGITEFVTTDIPGFEGILKKRFVNPVLCSLSHWLDNWPSIILLVGTQIS